MDSNRSNQVKDDSSSEGSETMSASTETLRTNPVVSIFKQPSKASRSKKLKNTRIRFRDLEADDETSQLFGIHAGDDPVPSNSGTSPDSVSNTALEDELNEEAEYARAGARYCRSMRDIINDSIEIIQKETDDYLENVRADTRSDLTQGPYHRIARKLRGYIKILGNKVKNLETAARTADDEGDVAAEKAFFVGEVAPGGRPSVILQRAVEGGIEDYILMAHGSGTHANIEVNHALNMLKKILNKVKETKHPEELSYKRWHEYERDCVNRTWKSRIAHGIIFLTGIVILSCVVPLLEVRSDQFCVVTSLGILALVWSIGYWGYELYTSMQSCKMDTSPNVFFRKDTISRIDHIRLYERMFFIRKHLCTFKRLAFNSDTDSDDADVKDFDEIDSEEWDSKKKQ